MMRIRRVFTSFAPVPPFWVQQKGHFCLFGITNMTFESNAPQTQYKAFCPVPSMSHPFDWRKQCKFCFFVFVSLTIWHHWYLSPMHSKCSTTVQDCLSYSFPVQQFLGGTKNYVLFVSLTLLSVSVCRMYQNAVHGCLTCRPTFLGGTKKRFLFYFFIFFKNFV